MGHPTKEQMDFVINKLRNVEERANKGFDIRIPYVREHGYEWGTVHCVAGWYAVANLDRFAEDAHVGFVKGATLMAQDLGFRHKCDLEDWAYGYSDVWGNNGGAGMFYIEDAYDGLEGSDKPMSTIIAHLEAVRDRL